MKRRAFLGFLGGAAASGPTLAKSIAGDAVLKQAGFAAGGAVCGAAPTSPPVPSNGTIAKAVRWIRRKGIPEWKMHDLRRQADYERQHGIDPDIACLVSVSPGWKARTQRKRNLNRVIDRSLASIGRSGARNAFEQKMQKQFGEFIDWYD